MTKLSTTASPTNYDRLERAPVALLRVSIELQDVKVSRARWALVAFVLLGLVVLLGAWLIALIYG